MTVLRHQRGSEEEREFGGGCSVKRTFQTKSRKGSQKLLITTVDTDIMVLEIAYVERLGVQKLWTAFGTKKKFRYLAAHAISQALGSAKSRALPMFRSFTRCDMVSELAGNGKKCMVGLGSVSEDNRVIQALIQLVQRMMDITHRLSVL